MRRFSGAGGSLFALGERLSFRDLPLENCGDGWDWRAPLDMSHWVELDDVYALLYGECVVLRPAELHIESGRVGLPRNMSRNIFANGACLPISEVCAGESWELHMDAVTPDSSFLGEGHSHNQTRVLGMTGILIDAEVPISTVLARFPTGGAGLFIGVGEARQSGSDVEITFNQEGVKYVLG